MVVDIELFSDRASCFTGLSPPALFAQFGKLEAIAGYGEVVVANALAKIGQAKPQVALGEQQIAGEVVRILIEHQAGFDGGAAVVTAGGESLRIAKVEV